MASPLPIRVLVRWFPDRASRVYLVLSLSLAVFLWVWTTSEAKVVHELEVPVVFVNVPEDLVVVGPDAHRSVVTQVRGPKEIVKRIRQADVEIRVDLSKSGMGPQVVEVTRQSVRLPSTVELVAVKPSTLRISMEKLVTASLPVQPTFAGEPPGDLEVVSWVLEPASAQVKGPRSKIKKLTSLGTQQVSLERRREPFTEAVLPVSPDPEVTVLPGSGWNLRVRIGEKSARRTLDGVRVRLANARRGTTVDPASVQVSVQGPASAVATLTAKDFRCEINTQGLAPADAPYKLKPAVALMRPDPTGRIEVTAVSPHFVSVRVGGKR